MSKQDRDPAERGRINSTMVTLVAAGVFAFGVSAWVNTRHPSSLPSVAIERKPESSTTLAASAPAATATAQQAPAQGSASLPATSVRAQWAASATGRIEPKDGELRLAAPVPGRIIDVLVKANQQVPKGALLVRLDDEDALLKVAAANSETDVRKRERDEEQAQGLALERRKAEDAVADAERALFKAKMGFDAATMAAAKGGNGGGGEEARALRVKITQAEERVAQEKAALASVNAKPGMPLPTRLESSLQVSRDDTLSAEAAVEKLRLRAPYEGTVLAVNAKVGELSQPSAETALITFGDLTGLRVRAEVEERDAGKVRVGQKVVVRADAYPAREFEGEVTSVSQSLSPPRIAARGPRRPSDVEVLEVLANLDGNPPLLSGMRVDVYFKLDKSAEANAGVKR